MARTRYPEDMLATAARADRFPLERAVAGASGTSAPGVAMMAAAATMYPAFTVRDGTAQPRQPRSADVVGPAAERAFDGENDQEQRAEGEHDGAARRQLGDASDHETRDGSDHTDRRGKDQCRTE